jgi:hypothetical protein
MTYQEAAEEMVRLEGWLPQHNGYTPTAYHRKIGMRIHELAQFSIGNTDTVDENWKQPVDEDV